MIAIRGATTVELDSSEQIAKSVGELLAEIFRRNNLNGENTVCMIFSSTPDLRSYYPATAAREAGYGFCPLFSAQEPDIIGSIKRCVRVIIFAEADFKPSHVYLNEAVNLRRDLTNLCRIAIDGPAGSGKSTVSKILGKKLNILCLDTGAMYRACALKCLKENISVKDEKSVEKIVKSVDLKVNYENGLQKTVLDGEDVSEKIRRPEISMLASELSALACVRQKMVALQREIALGTSCVLDGRDIGTNVLPEAEFKFYLTASPEVRARRRFLENRERGFDMPYETILEEIKKRDEQDKTRKIAPLVKASDALFIDSSVMSAEEVAELILNKIGEKQNDR